MGPDTVIVVHEKERRSKCSVEPLRGRKGFSFVSYPLEKPVELAGYVRLAMEGPRLSLEDRASGLLVLDATWRLADRMESAFAEVPPRSLPYWETAYPRVSKLLPDPEEGLATIEAIYVAHLILGRPTDGLLREYRWGELFLERNRDRF
ncbi:hypothetical protein Pan216_06180 [Planctomycetes bacterium Pan216]|uniref:16S/18S rRNA aminocarboxypropyltransferase Tsr3 C-terminal domain-containing protein n=1 Tax=Kolteria novifilia TaxID=2527975 RepID=A0A518AYI2_9BACT|nr:hypothetical protein Pan216_06180 [Planctomycetes bacterium Pan216]